MIHKQTWWDDDLPRRYAEFESWIGDYNAPSKVWVRSYVRGKGYRQLLDCGCGPATEYFGYRSDGDAIEYTGLDSSSLLVRLNRDRGIRVVQAAVERLPFRDGAFEVVFSRHVLEHLADYSDTVLELVRVARREVIVVFFLKPDDAPTSIVYDASENLYHNRYNQAEMNAFIASNRRVARLDWDDLDAGEAVLHIHVAADERP